MKWIQVERISYGSCQDVYSFRGKFYAVFVNGDIFVFDPYSMEVTPLMPQQDHQNSSKHLVPCGNEELFLIEQFNDDELDLGRLACRVSRLDEEAGKWIVVSDLGDRVLFIGELGNVACSGEELPDGCGLSGNSILFTYELGKGTFAYKYGVDTGNVEDDLSFWRLSRENRVVIRNEYPPVVAFLVGRSEK